MAENIIINRDGQVSSISGPKAVEIYAIRCLMLAIKLYLDTGMLPTRGVTPTRMRDIATSHTGKNYKRGRNGLETAAADLKIMLEGPEIFEGVDIHHVNTKTGNTLIEIG